jgi:hypothetical protein
MRTSRRADPRRFVARRCIAQYARCGGPRLPSDENARVKARFERACQNEVALVGSGVTQATLDACSTALELSPCELPDGPPAACDFRGNVPGGGACTDGVQCASGACMGQQAFSPEGPTSPMKCGACAPVVGLGEVCGDGACEPSALCLLDPTTTLDAGSQTYRCTLVTHGNVGASCDGLASKCAAGLYCAAQTGQCAELASSGAPCGEAPGYPGGCVAPLACVGPPGSTTCRNTGTTGAACAYGLECNPGLACVPPNGTCVPAGWAGQNEACNGYTVLCRVGSCALGFMSPPPTSPDGGLGWSTCATVISDGQPCKATDACDTFSDCVEVSSTPDSGFAVSGTCMLHDTTLCH